MALQLKKRNGAGRNKGARTDGRRAFTQEQVQLIRLCIQAKGDRRELALFETALSTMLRVSDFLALTVAELVDTNGEIVPEFFRAQKKTQKSVKCNVSLRARTALKAYLFDADGLRKPKEGCLWTEGCRTLKRVRYSRIIKSWARMARLDPKHYSTHSMRKTTATFLYRETHNVEAVRRCLGHGTVAATSKYLSVEVDDALALLRRHEL